jgi:hypothetical protein
VQTAASRSFALCSCEGGKSGRAVGPCSSCSRCRWQPFRWLTYSCNGFHEEEPEHLYGGIGNLWRDVMARHTQQPFHLQVRRCACRESAGLGRGVHAN